MARCKSSSIWHSVQWGKLQRGCVHQHEESSSSLVYHIKSIINAIDVIHNGSLMQTAISQESSDPQIICSDPYRVNGVIRPSVGVEGVCVCGGIDVFGICNECVGLVDHVWKGPENACEVAVDNFVVADGSRDGVII